MSLNTSSQTNTTSNHSFLIDAHLVLAVSGSAQSVFVGSNQIEASEEKLYLARRWYTDREQGERNKTPFFFFLHVHWDTSKIPKKGAENAERSIWEPGLKTVGVYAHTRTHTHTHTHTHILSLMTDSRHNTPERGNKSVLCPVFETAVTLSSAGCHTLCMLS